jgi:hypothetical protein
MDGVIGSRLTVLGRHTVPITPSPFLSADVNRQPSTVNR